MLNLNFNPSLNRKFTQSLLSLSISTALISVACIKVDFMDNRGKMTAILTAAVGNNSPNSIAC